jgi:integrase
MQGRRRTRRAGHFPFTTELRSVLVAQRDAHRQLGASSQCVFGVWWRTSAAGREAPKVITSFNKAWKIACRAAGCPDRIPHDLRRAAIRNFVRSGTSENVAMKFERPQNAQRVRPRYDIVSGDDLREAARRLNAR